MKILKRLILPVIAVFLLFSCKKSFLNLHSKQATDAKLAIVDMESMRYADIGVYALLQNAAYYNRTFYFLPELVSDNIYLSKIRNGYYTAIGKFTASADHSRVRDMWNQIYRTIVNSNFIIQEGSALDVPDKDKKEQKAIIGEAYAIKALAHFDLCRLFAQPYNFTSDASHPGVPIVQTSSFKTDEIIYPARNTVKEVYDTVVLDLKKAIEMLPEHVPGEAGSFKGRITLNAAKALLSRVYLYMGNWEDCERMASQVIDSKQYALLPTNKLVSDYSLSNNEESIFEIVNTETDNSGSNGLAYYYNQDGYGDPLPSWELYNLYSDTDVRKGFMEIGNRSRGGGEKNVPLVTKFRKLTGSFEQDEIVIRLAEVYLNRAEARANLKDYEGAIEDLEVIAQRADPSVVIDHSLTGQDLIDRILLERRKELAFEGHRLFDLTRNKRDFVKYYSDDDSTIVTYPDEKAILPIPQNELDVNANLEQNPGY